VDKAKVDRKVEVVVDTVVCLGEVGFAEYYLDPRACFKARETFERKMKDMYGGALEYIVMPRCECPHLSYGHMACLGATLLYPEDGDPGIRPFADSVEEAIRLARRDVDFSQASAFKERYAYYEKLKALYPGQNMLFTGFGYQGPVTSAVLMRGQDFFTDIYENPEAAKELLGLLTESILAFGRFLDRVNSITRGKDAGAGVSDDFAAFLPPGLLDEFVVPYWSRIYEFGGKGPRGLHCEGFHRAHLPCLEKCGVTFFQANISPQLTCQMLAEELDIRFDWLLPPFELPFMDKEQIECWVDATIATGASPVRTETSPLLYRNNAADKVNLFLDAFRKHDGA